MPGEKRKKDALRLDVLLKAVEIESEKAFIFLTLTAPNVKSENLSAELDAFNLAWKNLLKRQEIKPVVKATFASSK